MKSAILLLNFGEPERAVMEEVVPYLTRIFGINDRLEGRTDEPARERALRLAELRAPGLIREYERIGGSPLRAQAGEQADRLKAELTHRGHDVECFVGMQFTEPFIVDAVRRARSAGAEQVVALPIYPLCGPSTTVAALERLEADMRSQQWAVPLRQISGWHRHPSYIDFRASVIRDVARRNDLSFDDPRTKLVFSAHGTPMKYIEEGSRYEIYVRDLCAAVAGSLGVRDYVIGYQNHTNRPIDWTQPDVEQVIADVDADRVVVDAVSFMHEQSETLAELDHELRGTAEARGLEFHRVPIRHAAPEFISFLADLTEPFLGPAGAPSGSAAGGSHPWKDCQCKAGAYCMNARDPVTR